MGQRLNIEIARKDKVIAASYYHWSGYTVPAIELTQEALKTIIKNKKAIDDADMAIRALESTGAGLEPDEAKDIDNGQNYKIGNDRNNGFISVRKETISNFENWQEADTLINLLDDEKDFKVEDVGDKIYVDLIGSIYTFDEEELKEEYGLDENQLKTIPVNMEDLDYDDLKTLLIMSERIDNKFHGNFKDLTGQIYHIIG